MNRENKNENDSVSPLLAEIRNAFADYWASEGCSCCRDTDNHKVAESRLGKLLNADPYFDFSGFDWGKYKTK